MEESNEYIEPSMDYVWSGIPGVCSSGRSWGQDLSFQLWLGIYDCTNDITYVQCFGILGGRQRGKEDCGIFALDNAPDLRYQLGDDGDDGKRLILPNGSTILKGKKYV